MSKHNFGLAAAPTPKAFDPWHLHTGTVKLYICGPGPGPDSMLACSESYYSGQIGSDEERQIAAAAIAILNQERPGDKDAGPTEIRAALERARTEILALNPQPFLAAEGNFSDLE